jgi:hypothetical protein
MDEMPNMNPPRTPTGKQVEEMIFNCLGNTYSKKSDDFHDDLYEKIPIHLSKKSTFDSCKGTLYYSCNHFTRKPLLILSDW